MMTIKRVRITTYQNNGTTLAWVECTDGSTIMGDPENPHMEALIERARRESLPVTREIVS